MLRLRFLGPILVEHEGQAVSGLSQGKMLALLGYLAVRRQPLSREHLADLFWQDLPVERGRAKSPRARKQCREQEQVAQRPVPEVTGWYADLKWI